MGTFINNLHVFVGDHAAEKTFSDALAVIRQHMQAAGYREVSALAEAQAVVTIASNETDRWVSIYHDLWEDVSALAVRLSQSLDHPTLQLMVGDSDSLSMTLYEKGQATATYSDWANIDQLPKQITGNAEEWHSIMPAGTSVEALKAAWQPDKADYPFESEGILQRAIQVLGLDRDRVWLKNRDLLIPNRLPPSVIRPEKLTPLYFQTGDGSPYEQIAEGLPKFHVRSYQTGYEFVVGYIYYMEFWFYNLGSAAHGFEVVLSGTSIEQSLIEPVGLFTEQPYNVLTGNNVATPTHNAATHTYAFNVPNHTIPTGIQDIFGLHRIPDHLRNYEREIELTHKLAIGVKALKSGEGMLQIGVRPQTNPDQGIAHFRTEISIVQKRSQRKHL